ncbi:hypothetical protein JL722_5342 [Aureococcus anophagefferens]|nr:hypothetical protein JL722_5342 [Aureococcus anophagefferens]
MALSSSVPADMKACKSFLQRAEELDRASDPNAKVVAYHCRQYAMELGIALRDRAADAEAATAFLLGLMDALEHEKKALGDVSREDGEQIVFQFASDVFARADAEDRARAATKNTARTFYAASVFFDALKQFGERGEEVEEKTRYAKWKATEILKAIKEGREVAPGGPGDEPELPDIPPTTPSLARRAAAQRAAASVLRAAAARHPGKVPTKAQFDDAIEYCKFAIAACEVKDTALALDRLRGAFTSLS